MTWRTGARLAVPPPASSSVPTLGVSHRTPEVGQRIHEAGARALTSAPCGLGCRSIPTPDRPLRRPTGTTNPWTSLADTRLARTGQRPEPMLRRPLRYGADGPDWCPRPCGSYHCWPSEKRCPLPGRPPSSPPGTTNLPTRRVAALRCSRRPPDIRSCFIGRRAPLPNEHLAPKRSRPASAETRPAIRFPAAPCPTLLPDPPVNPSARPRLRSPDHLQVPVSDHDLHTSELARGESVVGNRDLHQTTG